MMALYLDERIFKTWDAFYMLAYRQYPEMFCVKREHNKKIIF